MFATRVLWLCLTITIGWLKPSGVAAVTPRQSYDNSTGGVDMMLGSLRDPGDTPVSVGK